MPVRYSLFLLFLCLLLNTVAALESSSSTAGSSGSEDSWSSKAGTKRSKSEKDDASLSLHEELPMKKVKQNVNDKKSGMCPLASGITIDCSIEVYPFGHTKRTYYHDTVISLDDVMDTELTKIRKEIRAKYGILEDASRCGIGDFKVDLGIKFCNDSKVYIAQSETEWNNLLERIKNSLGNYSVLGNCTRMLVYRY